MPASCRKTVRPGLAALTVCGGCVSAAWILKGSCSLFFLLQTVKMHLGLSGSRRAPGPAWPEPSGASSASVLPPFVWVQAGAVCVMSVSL